MRIVYIAAGAGSMYCGACARDAALLRRLIAMGIDVSVIPLYTPLRYDGESLPAGRVLYGGISVYLRQNLPIARALPSRLLSIFDHPLLLNAISRFALSVDPGSLGPMTVSVLAGGDGHQHPELAVLLDQLRAQRPDVVNLTNSLLSGIAPHVKAACGAAVVCTLQGEDAFVAALPDPYRSQAMELIRRHARSIDLFIAPCQACATAMSEWLGLGTERIRVIRTGIDSGPYISRNPARGTGFTIGYLSSIRPAKGLDLLIEAMREIVVRRHRQARLLIGGQVLDKAYWRGVRDTIASSGLEPHCEYRGELGFAQKAKMLSDCDVFVQPSLIDEWRAVAAMEAMASAVPVIAPDAGVFPELLAGGGGVLFHRGETAGLANAIDRFIQQPKLIGEMGRAAKMTIADHFTADRMAQETIAVYQGFL